MNNPTTTIAFIGGIEVGKTSLITSLWPQLTNQMSSEYDVTETIPGRGSVSFKAIELPPILYSLPDRWLDNVNSHTIQQADIVVLLLSADSLGYKLEISFIKNSLKPFLRNDQHIVVGIVKSDLVLYVSEDNRFDLSGVSTLFQRQTSLYQQLHKNFKQIEVDSIVPCSALIDWNLESLKEKIWEGVIEKQNAVVYKEDVPTVVIAGKRGCGKSTTLNKLWNLGLPTNKAVACTKYPMVLSVTGVNKGVPYTFNVVDLPGIAESLDADVDYMPFYEKYIEKANLLICLSQADTRAYKQDEMFYKDLIKSKILTPKTSVILGINQVDLLFKSIDNLNGIDLNTISITHPLIVAKVHDYFDNVYAKIFEGTINVSKNDVCVFSAYKDWNLDNLQQMILDKVFTNL